MSIYSELQGVASGLLTEFDQHNIFLIQRIYEEPSPDPSTDDEPLEPSTDDEPLEPSTDDEPTEYDPDEPPEPTEKKYALRGVAKGVAQYFEKDGFVANSDAVVTTSVLPNVSPSKDDCLELDGIVFKILQFEPVPRVGVPCVWKFIVRKGG